MLVESYSRLYSNGLARYFPPVSTKALAETVPVTCATEIFPALASPSFEIALIDRVVDPVTLPVTVIVSALPVAKSTSI